MGNGRLGTAAAIGLLLAAVTGGPGLGQQAPAEKNQERLAHEEQQDYYRKWAPEFTIPKQIEVNNQGQPIVPLKSLQKVIDEF